MTTLCPKYLIDAIRSRDQAEIDRLIPKTNLHELYDDNSVLRECVICEDYVTLKKLLSFGANINLIHPNQQTILMDAETVDMLKFLIQHGANMNHQNKKGANTLEITIRRLSYFQSTSSSEEDFKMIQYLLNQGSDYKQINLEEKVFHRLSDDLRNNIKELFFKVEEKNHLELTLLPIIKVSKKIKV